MFLFFIFIFLFEINSNFLSSFNNDEKKIELISEEKNGFFQFYDDYEKIKIAFSIEENDYLISDFIFESVKNAFKIGGEIKLYKINFEKKRSLKDVYKKLKSENIFFYIIFFENEKTFSWKVFSVLEEKFLDGTVYQKSNLKNNMDLKISICSDLWKLLFESDLTPFDSSLVYIKNILLNGEKYSEIVTVNPFFDFSEKIRLKTNRAISDLSSINSDDNSIIVFSEVTDKNVRIVKLKENGGLSVLIDLPGTSGSLCSFDSDIFYIRSSKIYHCYYNYEKKFFIHERIKTEKKNDLNVSICKGPRKSSIICARNYKIYIIYYQKNEDGSLSVKEEKILSPKDSFATSVDYNDQSQYIFSSERIGKYNQIFSYEKDSLERKQLTNSNYSKNEISISPCGNYISYSVKNSDGTKRIEIINVYTKKTKVITENKNYGRAAWII